MNLEEKNENIIFEALSNSKNNNIIKILDNFYNKSNPKLIINQALEKFKPWTPLITAIYFKNIKAVNYLLKNNADPNLISDSIIPIQLAIVQKSLGIMDLLIKYGANMSVKNDKNQNALIVACETKDIGIIKKVIYYDQKDFAHKDVYGKNGMDYLMEKKCYNIVRYINYELLCNNIERKNQKQNIIKI